MTILKRRILIVVFILLFLLLAPIIIFYAMGNILGDDWNILATGGIYVKSTVSNTEFYLNGKAEGAKGFFNRDYFLKNLKPGVYVVLIKKDGYNSWTKSIKVFANRVSESSVFILPTKIDSVLVDKFIEEPEKKIGTTTKVSLKINPDYSKVESFFGTSSIRERDITILSTTTGKVVSYIFGTKENPIKDGHLSIWREGRDILAMWNGNVDSSPKIFCTETKDNVKCQKLLKIYSAAENINNLAFFPGESEVVMFSVGNCIYAIEAEDNPDKRPQVLFEGVDPDFIVYNNNTIYIKDNNSFRQLAI